MKTPLDPLDEVIPDYFEFTRRQWKAVDLMRQSRPISEVMEKTGMTAPQVVSVYDGYLRCRTLARGSSKEDARTLILEEQLDRLDYLLGVYLTAAMGGNCMATRIVLSLMAQKTSVVEKLYRGEEVEAEVIPQPLPDEDKNPEDMTEAELSNEILKLTRGTRKRKKKASTDEPVPVRFK